MKTPLLCLLTAGFLLLGEQPAAQAQSAAASSSELRIAFGSCNRHDLPQPLWDDIARDQPQVWIWLGDNIYGDTDDPKVLRAKYDAQLNQPGYRHLREQGTQVIGTWDDHDYGRNDGDKNYPFKVQNQQIALDFLQEPQNSPRRKQEGIYTSYTYTAGKKKVKVILLDDRYFQDPLFRDSALVYHPNPTGDVLGEAQWAWLRQQLTSSDADAHIIASGIQFLPYQHRFEKWANFPVARQRLLTLLQETRPKGVLLISGDRHIGEISRVPVPGLKQPVYEITSSGLTHPATHNTSEPNVYRVGPLVNQKHYALFQFRPRGRRLGVTASLRGDDGQIFYTEEIRLNR